MDLELRSKRDWEWQNTGKNHKIPENHKYAAFVV